MSEAYSSVIRDSQGVFFFGDKHHIGLVQIMHTLLIYQIELINCSHDILLNYFPTFGEEQANVAIWARGLFFWCCQNDYLNLLL
jgi:hypothetical protein